MSMIDLHCHVLPGIDDGPRSIEDSLLLARAAASAGIRTIVATPHVSREYPNDADTIAGLLDELGARLAAEGLPLELRSGAEIAMTMIDQLAPEALPRLALGGGPWLLIECPFTSLATGFDILLLKLQSQGHRIVLAHPERSPFFHRDPQLLGSLVRGGILTSITAGSLVGLFGGRVQRFTRELVQNALVHNVASDAHNHTGRPPSIRSELEQSGLSPLAEWLTQAVPAAILAGDDEIPPRPSTTLSLQKTPSGWWRKGRREPKNRG
jgi:protein-tyrosine phosphatase